jgi:hypothetical protein
MTSDKANDELKLTRRDSDFGKPVRSQTLYDAGCSSCCCLFWPGAVVGATAGIVICCKKSATSHPNDSIPRANLATLFVLLSFIAGAIFMAVAALFLSTAWPADAPPIAYLTTPMVFLPHLIVVPVGLIVIAVAVLKKVSEPGKAPAGGRESDEPLNPPPEPQFDGIEFACKLTWVTFWLGTLGMSVGVFVMFSLLG